MASLTYGGLTPAFIVPLNKSGSPVTSKKVDFHFNPNEFAISKTNTWSEDAGQGQSVPTYKFTQGGAQTISLTLHFDTQPYDVSVTSVTDKLWQMMYTDPALAETKNSKSRPPIVIFQWGKLSFKSFITQLKENFILFSATGVPLRSVVTINLQQYVEKDSKEEAGLSYTGNTTAPTITTVTESDRIDLLALAVAGSTAGWKEVAEQNDIPNPLSLRPGDSLKHS